MTFTAPTAFFPSWRQQEPWPSIQAALYQAALALGFPADPDMNGPESGGVGAIPMNNPDGIRMSTALTHLNAARHRLNLTVKSNILARRVLCDGQRAVGVEVESGGGRVGVLRAAES